MQYGGYFVLVANGDENAVFGTFHKGQDVLVLFNDAGEAEQFANYHHMGKTHKPRDAAYYDFGVIAAALLDGETMLAVVA